MIDPQDRKQRRALTLSLAALCFAAWSAAPVGAQSPPATPVVVATVLEREVAATQTFVGTVTPSKRATIGSAVDGRVVEFAVEEGDRVEAGQKLAQLLTETIGQELIGAEAELELRRQRLAELRNGSRPEEIEQTRARMAAAEARSHYEQARLKRTEAAYRAGGAVTAEEWEEAVAATTEASEALLEAKAVHAMAVAGPRIESIAQAEAEVAVQQATVQRLSDQIKKHTIISRFAGYVVAEHTESGAWVSRGGPVAEVIAIDEVEVVAQVVEQSATFIVPGSTVQIELPALPGRVFTGTVLDSAPQADVRSRTFPVRVLVKNEFTPAGPVLKAGMYARVALPVGARQQAMLIPKDAIVLGGATPVVYVVEGASEPGSEGTVRPTPVQLGVASGTLIQVTGQLTPGQGVVVEGNERLRPGQSVRIARLAPAPDGAA